MYCENCGKQIGDEKIACPYCGHPVGKEDVEFQNQQNPFGEKAPYSDFSETQYAMKQNSKTSQNKKTVYAQWWFWIIIGCIVVITAVSVVFILRSNDQKGNEDLQNSQNVSSQIEQENESTDSTETKVEARLTPKVTQPEIKVENNGGEEITRPEEVTPESGSTIVVPSSGDSTTTQASADEYIFQESNSRYLTEEEVRSKSSTELRLARNEIFARHGRLFKDDELQAYFSGKSWYIGTVPAESFNANVFNDYEKKNLVLIEKVENEKK